MRSGARPFRLALALVVAAATLAACDNQLADDPAADAGAPTALGKGNTIRDVMDPALATHANNNATVAITGATYLLVDSYDETHDGKSIGTVYMQDVPSPTPLPFAGVALYDETYVPTSLVPAPGDVLDLTGVYTASTTLGTAVFAPGTALIQIDKPIVTPRFEYQLPQPLVINASDLDNYALGQQWVSMLVTIENITFPNNMGNAAGRETISIYPPDPGTNGPTLDNELFDVGTWNTSQSTPPLAKGQTIKSVTGIVTWFFSYHISPRSPADIVVQ
jgi:hypothetical protein